MLNRIQLLLTINLKPHLNYKLFTFSFTTSPLCVMQLPFTRSSSQFRLIVDFFCNNQLQKVQNILTIQFTRIGW